MAEQVDIAAQQGQQAAATMQAANEQHQAHSFQQQYSEMLKAAASRGAPEQQQTAEMER